MKYLFDEIEHIKLLGRNAGKSAITHCYPLFYTGSGVELNVKGSELYVEFDSSFSTNENYICIYINNALIQRRMIDNCHERICIFRGMDSSTQTSHTKKWVRTLKNQYFSSQNSTYAAS